MAVPHLAGIGVDSTRNGEFAEELSAEGHPPEAVEIGNPDIEGLYFLGMNSNPASVNIRIWV